MTDFPTVTAGAATGIDVDSSLLRTLRTCLELTAMGTLVETSKGAGKKKKKKISLVQVGQKNNQQKNLGRICSM